MFSGCGCSVKEAAGACGVFFASCVVVQATSGNVWVGTVDLTREKVRGEEDDGIAVSASNHSQDCRSF